MSRSLDPKDPIIEKHPMATEAFAQYGSARSQPALPHGQGHQANWIWPGGASCVSCKLAYADNGCNRKPCEYPPVVELW